MAKGIKRKIAIARENVQKEMGLVVGIGIDDRQGFSSGLSGEGYNGGYRDALDDILLVLNGVRPNRRGFWDK